MKMEQHPCFNRDCRRQFARVHLPVAPRCNIQCKFCNRLFDCVNESRPGVTSALLSPRQAMVYLDEVMKQKPNVKVVGIAGPGDPFANVEQTLETLERVRVKYSDLMLCVATNGLNILPYVDELSRLHVSHVTITVNAIDPNVSAKIYSWMRIDKHVVASEKGAAILLERQLATIKALKEKNILVKVNAIILPGINDHHIAAVAQRVASIGVDLFNCMPYFSNKESALGHLVEPDKAKVTTIRAQAGKHIKQMDHCTRCRADAVGFLGETSSEKLMNTLNNCQHLSETSTALCDVSARPYVAVASLEGVLINQHLGEAEKLLIYGQSEGRIQLIEARTTPQPGTGTQRWERLAAVLKDCRMILVSGIGNNPQTVLNRSGVEVAICEGLIEEAVRCVYAGKSLRPMAVRKLRACGASCAGDMMGCG